MKFRSRSDGGALTAEQKHEAIKAAIVAMLDGKDEGSFTTAGLPNMKVLAKLCGFQLTKDEMEAAWAEVSTTDPA